MNKLQHRILSKYLLALFISMICLGLSGCVSVNVTYDNANTDSKQDDNHSALSGFKDNGEFDANGPVKTDEADNIPQKTGELELKYASQYKVDLYENGYRHVYIEGDRDYVIVPANMQESDLGISNAVIINMPCNKIYLAASSAVDLFYQIDSLECIKAISTKPDDLSVMQAVDLIDKGAIKYVGKYSGPDYEVILNEGCNIAIESTMINHSPKIKEELEDFEIPVITEHSSYESDPLGRLEWIKLYGVLTGKEEEAASFFDEQEAIVKKVIEETKISANSKKPGIAFFYISSNGYVNIRKPGDYFCKIIDIAGGQYALNDIIPEEENALSTMNIGWEEFYIDAIDADILIYNGTIDDTVYTLVDLISKNSLLSDFRAVKNKRVYVTNHNVYQESSAVAGIISELSKIVDGNDDADELVYFKKLD